MWLGKFSPVYEFLPIHNFKETYQSDYIRLFSGCFASSGILYCGFILVLSFQSQFMDLLCVVHQYDIIEYSF